MNVVAEIFFISALNRGQKKISTPAADSASNFSRNLINLAGGLSAKKNSFGVGSKLIRIAGRFLFSASINT